MVLPFPTRAQPGGEAVTRTQSFPLPGTLAFTRTLGTPRGEIPRSGPPPSSALDGPPIIASGNAKVIFDPCLPDNPHGPQGSGGAAAGWCVRGGGREQTRAAAWPAPGCRGLPQSHGPGGFPAADPQRGP